MRDVAHESIRGARMEWDQARFAKLPLPYGHDAVGQIDIADREAARLG